MAVAMAVVGSERGFPSSGGKEGRKKNQGSDGRADGDMNPGMGVKREHPLPQQQPSPLSLPHCSFVRSAMRQFRRDLGPIPPSRRSRLSSIGDAKT